MIATLTAYYRQCGFFYAFLLVYENRMNFIVAYLGAFVINLGAHKNQNLWQNIVEGEVVDNISDSKDNDMNVKKMMLYRQIGAKIAYYRTLRQMTQAELAKKVNLSRSSLGRIERGKYNQGVPLSTLLDIAEGLHIELASLVTFVRKRKKSGGILISICSEKNFQIYLSRHYFLISS